MSRKLITLLLQPAKILEHELSHGCQNDSVAGGLQQYIISWAQALQGQADDALVRRLLRIQEAFASYDELVIEARSELCLRTLKAIHLYTQQLTSASSDLTANAPLTSLPGIGPRRAELFTGLGITTVADLLRHYPFRYDDRRQLSEFSHLQHDAFASLIVTVTGIGNNRRPHGHVLSFVPATDGKTEASLVWFNQSWRATQFAPGAELFIIGQMKVRKQGLEFVVSEVEIIDNLQETTSLNTGRITPIYRLVKGLNQGMVRRLTFHALGNCIDLPESHVPEEICIARNLMPWFDALQQIHFPENDDLLTQARNRISYEEFFCLQVAVAHKRKTATSYNESAVIASAGVLEQLCQALPFEPTDAQIQVCNEIATDLQAPQCANRLIHGDVGSGKTVCAAFALAAAACAGRQAALMAPTELLAQQHHITLQKMLAPLGISPILLTGSEPAAQREAALQVQNGAAVVVGTHALFQTSVQFNDLAVVVIDEQHRFGVNQRTKLVSKGDAVNLFVMSATPIPRTLALTAYGDYDVSVLAELPPGRQPVKTEVLWGKDRKRAYETLSGLVAQGHQGYVICPLVDPTDNSYIAAAEKLYDRLRLGDFASFKIGLVHGRTEPTKREETMKLFSAGHLQILVATTIVEVGVDVPNATVMLVENAERFGLAQLHQLRGRVARGQKRGKCIMLTRTQNPDTINRLRILERISNGFLIAEEDLKQRGPGELTGMRQSGLPDLRMADLLADTATLSQAREDAFNLDEARHESIITRLNLSDDENWVL